MYGSTDSENSSPAYVLEMFGYVLLGGELCVLVGSEHVTTVPGGTVVVGVNVDVKSA